MATVRDRLWTWGHVAGSYNGAYGLPDSTLEPAEGAAYLGVPGLIQVAYSGKPEPPYDAYAAKFSPLERVVWSVVGAGGTTRGFEEELQAVQDLAVKFPNFVGAMMDDFFLDPERLAVYNPSEIATLRKRLHSGPKPLDLWVVLYDHQLEMPLAPHLAECDVVTS